MAKNLQFSFPPWKRRLLTRLSDYALPSIANDFGEVANKLLTPDKGQKLFNDALLSVYMLGADRDSEGENSDDKLIADGDSNPNFSLASYTTDQFAFETAKKALKVLTTTHAEPLRETFEYAHKLVGKSDRILDKAQAWLSGEGFKRSQAASEPLEKEEIAALTHHHLVALRGRVPLPEFLSADLHRCWFSSDKKEKGAKFRAALIGLQSNPARDALDWKPIWLDRDGKVIAESTFREQSMPDSSAPQFERISKFVLDYLAVVFDPNFDGLSSVTSKPGKPCPSSHLLFLPVFARQFATGNDWKRSGPFLGLIGLKLAGDATAPMQILKKMSLLLPHLNTAADEIQAAKEQEFWRLRIPDNVNPEDCKKLLRRYAIELCGMIPHECKERPPKTITARSSSIWLGETAKRTPSFSWPDQNGRDDLGVASWELRILKTTQDDSAFRSAALIRLQEAALRLAEIIESQEVARLRGKLSQAETQFQAVGHELQRIVPQIVDAPKHLRRSIQSALLFYALPAFTKLNDTHRSLLPEQLIGYDNSTYSQWLRLLITMTGEIEAMIRPGKGNWDTLPTDEREFKRWVSCIADRFIMEDLACPVPKDWKLRCQLGVVYLCALRNTAKHCFDFDSRITPPFLYRCDQDALITLAKSGDKLVIVNKTVSDTIIPVEKKKYSDGTAGAISYFLGKLREAHPEITMVSEDEAVPRMPGEDGYHRAMLPLI